MYLISLISVVCEGWGLQVIEDGTEKPGLGRAKMHMTSLKRGATKKASQQKLKKSVKKPDNLNRFVFRKQSTSGGFSVSYVSVSSLHSEEWAGASGCTGQGFGDFGIKCQPVLVCMRVRPS